MVRDDGGQAFPVPAGNFSGGESWSSENGMSLRDYFATKAYIPDEIVASAFDRAASEHEALPTLARWCYAWADAMLAARKENP